MSKFNSTYSIAETIGMVDMIMAIQNRNRLLSNRFYQKVNIVFEDLILRNNNEKVKSALRNPI